MLSWRKRDAISSRFGPFRVDDGVCCAVHQVTSLGAKVAELSVSSHHTVVVRDCRLIWFFIFIVFFLVVLLVFNISACPRSVRSARTLAITATPFKYPCFHLHSHILFQASIVSDKSA